MDKEEEDVSNCPGEISQYFEKKSEYLESEIENLSRRGAQAASLLKQQALLNNLYMRFRPRLVLKTPFGEH